MCLINKVYTAQDMRDAAKCLFACEVDLKHDNRDISKMLRQAADMMDRADGEAAAMREALEKVRFYLPYFLQYMRLHREDAEGGGYYERILDVVNSALSAPPMNCDVGTAEEQAKRFMKICYRQKCNECKLYKKDESFYECVLRWSQMPCKEGGEK